MSAQRPWRARYEWLDNGIKGVKTFRAEEDALRFSDLTIARANRTDRSVSVTVEHRGDPHYIHVSIAP